MVHLVSSNAISGDVGRSVERIPPHNVEAEASLLGAMLLSRDAVSAAIDARVAASDFYKPAHAHVFTAVMALTSKGEPADPITVAEDLRKRELLDTIGGKQSLLAIQASTPSSTNASHYAEIVKDLSVLRRLISVAGDIAEMGYSAPNEISKVLDDAESLVFEVAEHRVTDSLVDLRASMHEALDQLEQIYGRGQSVTGTATGYVDLDDLLLGLQESSLYVVAARPGMGKTSFALGAAANIAVAANSPVMFFSMEMSHLELAKRLMAQEARLDSRKISTGNIPEGDWARLHHAISSLAEAPLYIDDNPHCTVMEMRAKARRLRAKHGKLGAIFVDYLQLMSGPSRAESRQVEVSDLSRGLKILARELEVPVIAMSQLNRQLEYRQDKRPMLADLRESGSIEQDADVVMFLYRDESYNPDTDDRGIAEVIVAKHRSGPTGTIRLAFLDRFTKFANMAKS